MVFRGSPAELIGQARGKVWTITTAGERPNNGLSVVSTLQLHSGVQYRVVGDPAGHDEARPTEPSLEDGYIYLMRQSRDEARIAAPVR